MNRCTFEEYNNDTRDKILVDLRSPQEYEKETVPGAVNIPSDEFLSRMSELPMDVPVYLICYTGATSDDAGYDLEEEGFDEVYSIKGGFRSYLKQKLVKEASEAVKPNQRARDIERSIIKKFRKTIWSKFTSAIREYELIKPGDKIAVCISGGKDSMLLAKLFQELKKHGIDNFEVEYLVMNPGYNDVNYQNILKNAEMMEIPIKVFETQIFDSVKDIRTSPCYLCARMRRGYLYSKAKELGCNKIALGHHFDDVIETILMGMLYGAQMQSMMPKLHSTNFEGMELIRPLYLVREKDIIHWTKYNDLHFIRCACRFTEKVEAADDVGKVSKRAEVKQLIKELAKKDPEIEMNIFRSAENVHIDTMIAYKHAGEKHHFLDDYDSLVTGESEQF